MGGGVNADRSRLLSWNCTSTPFFLLDTCSPIPVDSRDYQISLGMSCRFCYADDPCKHCLNLEFYELLNPRNRMTWSCLDEEISLLPIRSGGVLPFNDDPAEIWNPKAVQPGWLFNLEKIKENAQNCQFCNGKYQGRNFGTQFRPGATSD